MLRQNQNNEVNLNELFYEILNHWIMIILSTILAAVIAYLGTKYLIVPQYQSTSRLYVLSKTTATTTLTDTQLGSTLTDDYMEVINSRPIVEQVIENLGLEESYGTLASKITLENPSNSRIIKITVTDSDPHNAKLMADEIADVSAAYIADKMDGEPPTVIQYGYDDGAQVSPNVRKNTMWGAITGAMFALSIIVLLYLMNDTIMSADDVERKLGLNLLGTLPLEEDTANDKTDDKKAGKKKSKKERRIA